MAEAFEAGVVEADVVRGPARAEHLAAGRELADEVGETAVVGIAAGLGAQDGDGVGRDLLPVDVESVARGSRKMKRAEFGGPCGLSKCCE